MIQNSLQLIKSKLGVNIEIYQRKEADSVTLEQR